MGLEANLSERKLSRREFCEYLGKAGLTFGIMGSFSPLIYAGERPRVLFLEALKGEEEKKGENSFSNLIPRVIPPAYFSPQSSSTEGPIPRIIPISYLAGIERDPQIFSSFERIAERVYSRDDFLQVIKETGKRKKLDFFLPIMHGSPYGVFFPDGSTLNIFDIREGLLENYGQYFQKRKGKNNSYFHSCLIAELEKDGFAELFFKALGINGEAPVSMVGMLPLLNKELKVPNELKEDYEVRVKGPDKEGFSFYDFLFEGVPFTFQVYQRKSGDYSYGYPIGTPQAIVRRFEEAKREGKIIPPSPDNNQWYHHEIIKIGHPWRYFENV